MINKKPKCSIIIFYSQTQVDDTNKDLSYLVPAPYTLESITISSRDVEDDLQHLKASKASGSDHSSPCLLKEGAYVLALLNSIQPFTGAGILPKLLERSQCFAYFHKG